MTKEEIIRAEADLFFHTVLKSSFLDGVGDDEWLTIEYLMQLHEISEEEAQSLLTFSKSQTINLKGCYGDGSIIFPMWKNQKYKGN